MRTTDNRYRSDQTRFELAMRMIGHEARTGTIRFWTGLSDDRIRKLYSTYFKFGKGDHVRRKRGRSPSQVAPLIRTPARALESGVFANLLLANELLCVDAPPGPKLDGNIDLGHRFCECFETHALLVPRASLTFEWSWNLLCSIRKGEELGLTTCETCSRGYVIDLLAIPRSNCPACTVFPQPAATDKPVKSLTCV